MNQTLSRTFSENFLNYVAERFVIVGVERPNTTDYYYKSLKTFDTYYNVAILVEVAFIEETVPDEFAALKETFRRYTVDYESDVIWADINGVGLYELDEFISEVKDSTFHTQEAMDDFYSKAKDAIKAIELAFYENTGIEITSIMTYDDSNYESINDEGNVILPVFGPNFSIPELTTSTVLNSTEHADKIGIYLYD